MARGVSDWRLGNKPVYNMDPQNALDELRHEAFLVPGNRRRSKQLGIAACSGGALDMATQLTGHLLELLLLSRSIIVC